MPSVTFRTIYIIVIVIFEVTAERNDLSEEMTLMSNPRKDMARLLKYISGHPVLKDRRLYPINSEGEIHLSIHVTVSQVFGVDEATGMVDSFVSFMVKWTDIDVTWNPDAYGGIKEIHLDNDKVWSPVLYLKNAGDIDSFMVRADDGVHLYANGTASYDSYKFLKSSCSLDLNNYPLDTQECYIVFIPATYIVPGLRIVSASISNTKETPYVKGNWVISAKSTKLLTWKDYSQVEIHLTLNRRRLFYVVCILLPLVITSFLIIFVFWIPPNSGERFSFLVSIFLANTMVLNLLGDNMPRSLERMPKLLQFVLMALTENFLALGCSIFVANKYEEEQKQVKVKECDVSYSNVISDATKDDPDTSRANSDSVDTRAKIVKTDVSKFSEKTSFELRSGNHETKFWKLRKGCCPCAKSLEMFQRTATTWSKRFNAIKSSTWDKIFFTGLLFIFVICSATIYLA